MAYLDGFSDADAADIGDDFAGDNFEQRSFAAAVFADQADAFAAIDEEFELVEQHALAKSFFDVVERCNGHKKREERKFNCIATGLRMILHPIGIKGECTVMRKQYNVLLAGLVLSLFSQFGFAQYVQTNLTSDLPGVAAVQDPNLVNPWGMAFSPTSPVWISDNGTGKATLYNGAGVAQSLVVTIPPTGS